MKIHTFWFEGFSMQMTTYGPDSDITWVTKWFSKFQVVEGRLGMKHAISYQYLIAD